ncbi:unnamed protein product [Dibothriocephalus latus]|uniref:Uncharacterized protein n=1 Tax=Dibothriocephalus latus TaxID=60516 RepID=A0A3P6UFE5_DIBLA|nr:unnamed protein product [Dibothriocephalus latus]
MIWCRCRQSNFIEETGGVLICYSPNFRRAPIDEVQREDISFEHRSKVLRFGNLVFGRVLTQLDNAVEWMVAVEVQYLRRIFRSTEHPGLEGITVFAADKNIKEDQVVVSILLCRNLYTREDAVKMFFKSEYLIPCDDDQCIIHISSSEFWFVVSGKQQFQQLHAFLSYES